MLSEWHRIDVNAITVVNYICALFVKHGLRLNLSQRLQAIKCALKCNLHLEVDFNFEEI